MGKQRGRLSCWSGETFPALRGRRRMSTQLDQIAAKAKSEPKLRFTSLAHLITPEFLKETWKQMNRRGASGVDGETTKEFEQGLDTRVQDLRERLKRGAYRAPPVRRVEIPKGPGKAGTRPLGIPTVEDRLLQRAVARILEAVFEADFLECSYGFRPGCNPHRALRALRGIIVTKKGGHLFEADIRGYFNHIQHEWLQKMVAHRIADPLILRLIGKWLNAGFMVGGVVTRTEEGSPQGEPISQFLAKSKKCLSKHRHWKRRDQQKQLVMMLRGFYQYFGLHHCKPKLDGIRREVHRQWVRTLRRRSQRHRLYWSYLLHQAWFELPYAASTRHATV